MLEYTEKPVRVDLHLKEQEETVVALFEGCLWQKRRTSSQREANQRRYEVLSIHCPFLSNCPSQLPATRVLRCRVKRRFDCRFAQCLLECKDLPVCRCL